MANAARPYVTVGIAKWPSGYVDAGELDANAISRPARVPVRRVGEEVAPQEKIFVL
ncbi:MAG: hypothetical protein OXC99_00410 [Chloroflexi bacterium]|nr:hypothetical protein [Chloroflexota bacterium]